MKTKNIARVALLAAAALVLLIIAGFAPSAQLGLTAVAGIASALAVIHMGIGGGFLCWAVVAVLGFIIVPTKGCAVMYAIFFGVYPVIKSLIERLNTLWLEWLIKLLFFNAVLTVCIFALKALFFEGAEEILKYIPLLYLGGSIVFIIYDIGFSRLISFYYGRVNPKGI